MFPASALLAVAVARLVVVAAACLLVPGQPGTRGKKPEKEMHAWTQGMVCVYDVARRVVRRDRRAFVSTRILSDVQFFTSQYMRRFTSTAPACGARTPNRAISNSCL